MKTHSTSCQLITPTHPAEEIADASVQYLQTGKIADILLPCYDQHGKWLGETAASEFVEPAALKKLAKVTIPENRRIVTNERRESILLTSYMLKEPPDPMEYPMHVVPWHEIRGMCLMRADGNIHCPNLKRLNTPYSAQIEGLTLNLPELVVAHLLTLHAEHVSIPKLTQVNHLTFETSRHIEAPALQVANGLHLGPAFSARFAQLTEVKGAIIGYAIREFSAPLLETVNRGAYAYDGLVLPEAWTIDTPNLKYVGKRLDSSSVEQFYPAELTVEGTWTMNPAALRIKTLLLMRGAEQIEL